MTEANGVRVLRTQCELRNQSFKLVLSNTTGEDSCLVCIKHIHLPRVLTPGLAALQIHDSQRQEAGARERFTPQQVSSPGDPPISFNLDLFCKGIVVERTLQGVERVHCRNSAKNSQVTPQDTRH